MKINEIPYGNTVSLEIVTSAHTIELSTKVAELSDYEKKTITKLNIQKDLFCNTLEVIVKDGKSLGLSASDNMVYNIKCTINDKYYVWNNVYVKTVKLPSGNVYYLIMSALDVNMMNRRNAYRLWIGEEVTVTLGLSQDRIRGILKDISASGMGVIVADASDFHLERIVHVQYIDKEKTVFNLTGKVVSVTEISPAKILIGCAFVGKSQAIERYVSQKQIERAKDRKGR